MPEFFQQRPAITPTIYCYRLIGVESHKGYIKVGYTERDVETRVKEQIGASHVPYEILWTESAMCEDGSIFFDSDVHAILERKGFTKLNIPEDNEWYNCSVDDVRVALYELHTGNRVDTRRTATFSMRPEQADAVQKTKEYFEHARVEDPDRIPKFLWNAKMRFGKTFASYQLAKKMGLKRVLILTFKPAVESAWHEDLVTHVDFEGWQFISNKDAQYANVSIDVLYEQADKSKPIVVFGSFQDLLGTNDAGGIKEKNEFIHLENWDLVIFDEYHFGAWRENAAKLFEDPDEDDVDFDVEKYGREEAGNAYNESFLPITTNHYLFLSGTPFRAVNSGEFIEDQIYSWTYSDEQREKANWHGSGNPYLSLPRMVLMTYRVPESISSIVAGGEFDTFDLNEFFAAKPVEKGKLETSRFVYESEVQKWLDLIRGKLDASSQDELRMGAEKPPMPFSDTRLLNVLSHTLWFLPNVASCFAMKNLLGQQQNRFYHEYTINVCAGTKAGIGLSALAPVQKSMGDPLKTKTITLSCGKLTTGVTVKPWSGIFMLRNLKSPETYFQAAFRVQSPWTIKDELGHSIIMKEECYVFDFALDRALKQIADYSCQLDSKEHNPEKKVAEFISFLPVLAFDGSTMKQVNAQDILDFTAAGTTATLLARRWQSALLVNVDNATLKRLMENERAMKALESIEAFRSLNQDIQTIINKSEAVKKKKQEGRELSQKEKRELNEEEKKSKSLRKQIQDKLMKFATRIPIFMYLTDNRERALIEVIESLEPSLFRKVTGLTLADFHLLNQIGIFNNTLMNDAVFKFKRYEDDSLTYTGINKHAGKDVGGWDVVMKREEFEQFYFNQQATMQGASQEELPEEEPVVVVPKVETSQPPVASIPIVTVRIPIPSSSSVPSTAQQDSYVPPEIHEGDKVIHAKFGEGTVSRITTTEKRIYVKFGRAEKIFAFPDAFRNGFLTT